MANLEVHFKEEMYFWGIDLVKAREALNLSQAEFAEKCGWTQQHQSQLELPGIEHKLDSEKKEALTKIGIHISSAL